MAAYDGPKWPIPGLGGVPIDVMDEACRSGWVRPGLWAGEGLYTDWNPDGTMDKSSWKITTLLADRILADCPRYAASRNKEGGLAGLGKLPTWAPYAAAGAVALWLWSRR